MDDIVYGRHAFTEPVLVEIIDSAPVQRLKRISQQGVPQKWNHIRTFMRYDHDIGTAILIARVGGSLEEQVAGLLHDISHTAFSHLIDYVVGTGHKEDFQDRSFYRFLQSSEIPRILERHGYSARQFRDLHRFTLLEQEIPRLCADRLDYCFRQMAVDGEADLVRRLAGSVAVSKGRLHFSSKRDALDFGRGYLRLQKHNWTAKETGARYQLLVRAIRAAMKAGEITKEDFFTDDETMVGRLESSENPEVIECLSDLTAGRLRYMKERNKLRYVDPTYIEDGKVMVLSEENLSYRKSVESLKRGHH